MFLKQLSCFRSDVIPRSRLIFLADFKTSSTYIPKLLPAPHPWWSGRRSTSQHPGRLYYHLPAQKVCTTQVLHRQKTQLSIIRSCWCSVSTAASLMTERRDGDRGPPYKRRKSTEKSHAEREESRTAAWSSGGKVKDGGGDHRHKDLTGGRYPLSNQHRGYVGADQTFKRESFKDRSIERTKAANTGWTHHKQGGCKSDQTEQARTRSSRSEHEQDPGYAQQRNRKGPEEKVKGPSRDEGLESQMQHTTRTSKSWWGPDGQPAPPGTSPAERLQDKAPHVKTLQREWESCTVHNVCPPPEVPTAFDFSVMSYNILSQELLQDNLYLYKHCNPSVLPWSYRLPNLLLEIQQHDADILCLQEVQKNHYENQIKPALQNLGYSSEYKKRTGDKPDGCAVFYKSSRLSLVSSNPVEFFRVGDVVLDRDNVGLILLLRPNDASGQTELPTSICVANTHLLYNPRRGDIKLAQLAILLAEINRLSCCPDGSTLPVVLCGDFNSTPWSPLYYFLTTGCLEYGGLQTGMVSGQENPPRGYRILRSPILSQSLGINHQCQYESTSPDSPGAVEGAISNLTVEDVVTKAAFNRSRLEHRLKLQSSYQHFLMPDGIPEVTTCHSHAALTVDYILFTPELVGLPLPPGVRGLQLLSRLALVGQSELEGVNGLPNEHQSSDHLPLIARFRLWH